MGFCGRENKNDMRRRLFQRFSKSIEGRGREHVHFINDVDFLEPEEGGNGRCP